MDLLLDRMETTVPSGEGLHFGSDLFSSVGKGRYLEARGAVPGENEQLCFSWKIVVTTPRFVMKSEYNTE